MSDAKLECPLCCNEIFTSYSGLKYHLLSIIDNLTCTVCSKRFDGIIDLAEHLGRECRDKEEKENTTIIKPEPQVSVKPEFVNCENEDSINNSILAQALMKNKVPQTNEYNTSAFTDETSTVNENDKSMEIQDASLGENDLQNEDIYYCSSCAVSFTSISDHLEKFHDGQEVFIEDSGEDLVENEEERSFLVVQNKDGQEDDTNDSEECEDTTDTESLCNTLKQEDIFDKDGRLYTRKVVQIEKFWDDSMNSAIKQPPLTQKYILDSGKAIKIDGEISDVKDKNILNIYQCELCSLHFCKLDQYYKHNCNLTDKSNDFKCTKCSLEFFNAKSLTNHMKTHKPEKPAIVEHIGPYVCEVCSTEFPSYKSLRLHKRMHDPIKVKEIDPPVNYGITGEGEAVDTSTREMFLCDICKKTYDKQYEEVHMKSHSSESNYDCEICNRKFYTQSNLEMHMRVHLNGKKFTCSYCKKAFLSYESLQQHVKLLCQSRPYECQYCGRRFMRPHEKVKHERIHTGEKPHVCEICGKAFRVSYCLTLHMRTHSGTRPYQCPHCGKRFKAHSVYNHHLLTHSNVRNYKCPYCPKAFKTGVQLAGHKNSHTKPFTCTECNRPFASLYAVRAHMETHKRENNLKYSCWLCGASYARAFALRDHIKEQHAGEPIRGDAEELLESEYEMVAEGVNASNTILNEGTSNDVLVVLEQNIENVEMVEEVGTVS